MSVQLHTGDMREVLAGIDADTFEAVVCDPPYGLSFMGKGWDRGVPGVEFWQEALRVAKPGAHLLAFGGTRTFHRLACAIEDAGWELRDCIMWVYGSGFPKSLDVGKAIDKAAGAEREKVLVPTGFGNKVYTEGSSTYSHSKHAGFRDVSAPVTDAARQWQGWGTALKPAWEPIIVARKPLAGTVAANVLEHGTGAINIDGCRVGFTEDQESPTTARRRGFHASDHYHTSPCGWRETNRGGRFDEAAAASAALGRWPANLIHDGSDEVLALFPDCDGVVGMDLHGSGSFGGFTKPDRSRRGAGAKDSGSAARFFYCAKTNKKDRDEGCEGLEERGSTVRQVASEWKVDARHPDGGYATAPQAAARNNDPTVKPTALMHNHV